MPKLVGHDDNHMWVLAHEWLCGGLLFSNFGSITGPSQKGTDAEDNTSAENKGKATAGRIGDQGQKQDEGPEAHGNPTHEVALLVIGCCTLTLLRCNWSTHTVIKFLDFLASLFGNPVPPKGGE